MSTIDDFKAATKALHTAELAVNAAKERYTKALQALHTDILTAPPASQATDEGR